MRKTSGRNAALIVFKVVALLLVTLSLVSCGKKQDETGGKVVLEPVPTVPTHVGKDISESPFVGSFTCTWSSLERSTTDFDVWDGRRSTITINEDGTFSLSFDSLSSGNAVTLATVKGTVSVSDDTATCIVTDRSIDSYLGSDVNTFTLTLIDTDDFRYKGDQQGLVGNRDIFSRD
ncbi:MAG: hypothetical protein J5744_02490 [Oscillospiraceae bacterium]|nr:hypothetical protein [Oscillospiraceae bacterium]